MTAQVMQLISQIVIVVGVILGGLGGFGSYYYGKKIENSLNSEMDKSNNVIVTGNSGQTQTIVNSPGSSQIINQKRIILPEFTKSFELKNGVYVLKIILKQSSGLWNAGEKFRIQLGLSGPYLDMKFIQGFPSARSNVSESTNKSTGYYSFETDTSPVNDSHIILEVYSLSKIDILQIKVDPSL